MAIITSAELQAFLGIDDNEDQAVVTFAVEAANWAVTEYCGRSFDKTATSAATARLYWPQPCSCPVDDFWETTVLVVKLDPGGDGTFEQTLTLNTDFYLKPVNGLLAGQTRPYGELVTFGGLVFPSHAYRPTVQVTAAWGWASIPGPVKLATLIKAGKLMRRPNSLDGVLGGFADFTAVRISSREDPDVVSLLGPFRKDGLAIQVA